MGGVGSDGGIHASGLGGTQWKWKVLLLVAH